MTEGEGIAPWAWRSEFVQHADTDVYGLAAGIVVSMAADVDTGKHARPGFASLQWLTRIKDDRTLRDRLRSLEAAGWLHVAVEGGSPKGGKRLAREWSLSIPPGTSGAGSQNRPPTPDGSSRPPTPDGEGQGGLPPSHAPTTPIPRGRPPAPDGTPPSHSPSHDQERARGVALLADKTPEMVGELRGILARLDADFGAEIVDHALADAGAGGLTYRWPSSELRPVLAATCERLASRRVDSRSSCDRCRGSRWDPDQWDDTSGSPVPCSACSATEAA